MARRKFNATAERNCVSQAGVSAGWARVRRNPPADPLRAKRSFAPVRQRGYQGSFTVKGLISDISLDTKKRITHARFTADGQSLIVSGATGQEQPKQGAWPPWGRLQVYRVEA